MVRLWVSGIDVSLGLVRGGALLSIRVVARRILRRLLPVRVSAGILSGERGAGSMERGVGINSRLHAPCSTLLPLQTDVEAEDLRFVGVGFGDREGKVESDRGRTHRGHGDPQA